MSYKKVLQQGVVPPCFPYIFLMYDCPPPHPVGLPQGDHKRLRNVLLHIVSPWLLYVIVMIAYVDNFVFYDRSRFCLICPSLRQILENATCREVTHFERYNFHPTHGPSLPIKHGSLSKTAVIRKSSQMVWLSFASSWDKRVMNFIERSNSCH